MDNKAGKKPPNSPKKWGAKPKAPAQARASSREMADEQSPTAPHFAFSPLTPGDVVADQYRIISPIGQGGMGVVYEVEQIFLQKRFALKVVNLQNLTDVGLRRFQKEAQALAVLDDPCLAKVVSFGLLNGTAPYLVMNLVKGVTLSALIKSGALSHETILIFFKRICRGLAYAHSQGIVHRDIKPSNIIVENAEDSETRCLNAR